MRPCPEFYGSDARRTPAAAPQLLTPLCRTRVDQRARAARASRTRLPRRNARRSGASHRARFSLARRAPAVRTPFVAGVEAHLALRAKRERPIAALRFTSSSDSGLSKTPIRPPETLAFLPNRASARSQHGGTANTAFCRNRAVSRRRDSTDPDVVQPERLDRAVDMPAWAERKPASPFTPTPRATSGRTRRGRCSATTRWRRSRRGRRGRPRV